MNKQILCLPLKSNKLYYVNVEIKSLPSGKVRAKATVSDAKGNVDPRFGTFVSKPQLEKNRTLAVNEILSKAEDRYQAQYGSDPATVEDMRDAYDTIFEEVKAGSLRIFPSWKSPTTNLNALVYFERHGLSFLESFADPNVQKFLSSDRDELFNSLVADSSSKNKNGEMGAKVLAEKRMLEFDAIYAHMRDQVQKLPVISLKPTSHSKPSPPPEQVKYLPRRVLVKFYHKVKELVKTDSKFAFFTILVIFGLRPGEAAARKPDDIVFYDEFCVVFVNSSVEKGKIKQSLKNDFSRRPVVIPFWGRCQLKDCVDQIGDDYPKEDNPMNNASICAAKVKDLLISCGASEALLEEMTSSLSMDEIDKEDLSDISILHLEKIACYVLRRIFATICRSVMGLSAFETDRLLGHKPVGQNGRKEPLSLHKDMNCFDTQADIARRMERYVFDPECTLNPYHHPIEIKDQESVDLIPFSEYQIVNQSKHDVVISFNIEAAETGETIRLDMPSTVEQELNVHSKAKEWMGQDREVIGDTSYPRKAKTRDELSTRNDGEDSPEPRGSNGP